MGKHTPGRRVHSLAEVTQPGDYFGPVVGYTGDKPAVFFLLPNARDENAKGHGRSIHHVVHPPHWFIEQDDGSLSIQGSIGAQPHWHGYLTRGHWEECD